MGTRTALAWTAIAGALLVPLGIAATSPLNAWREPVYIVAGLAGVIGLWLLLLQPLLAARALPGPSLARSARLHRRIGIVLLAAVAVHVVGLWITSPPDVVDALLLRSATPFSLWGVIAMWAIVLAAVMAALRRRLSVRAWRIGHTVLVCMAVAGSVAHALMIEGTMGTFSKALLCLLAVGATLNAVLGGRARNARRTPARTG